MYIKRLDNTRQTETIHIELLQMCAREKTNPFQLHYHISKRIQLSMDRVFAISYHIKICHKYSYFTDSLEIYFENITGLNNLN